MELERILARTLFAYGFASIVLRLAGKTAVRQANAFEFVLLLILADLFDDLFWSDVPVSQFVVAAGTLAILQLALSMARAASPRFERWVENPPRLLIRHGKPLRGTLRNERLSRQAAERLIRRRGIPPERWAEIRSAMVESGGEVSVLVHEWARPANAGDAARIRRQRK